MNWLKSLVEKACYEPILAIEFKREGSMSIHEHALLLLHNCKYAVFDVSTKGGHLMEIERAFYDYKKEGIFICFENAFSTLSGMLDDLKPKLFSFKDFNELKQIINVFFKNLQ